MLLDNPLPKELEGRIGKSYFMKYRSSNSLEIPMYVVESVVASKPGSTVVYVLGDPWSEVYDVWSTLINSLSDDGARD